MSKVVLGLLVLSCGSAPQEVVFTPPPPEVRQNAEPVDDGMEVEGTLGKISDFDVREALDRKIDDFFACFRKNYLRVPALGGEFLFSFRVDRQGKVLWVYPKKSTLGDRKTEICLLEEAARTRFDPPRGGEAEFDYAFNIDAPENAGKTNAWPPAMYKAQQQTWQNAAGMQCAPGDYFVTFYLSSGGKMRSAGVSSANKKSAEDYDCISNYFLALDGLPDPTPNEAKSSMSFSVTAQPGSAESE